MNVCPAPVGCRKVARVATRSLHTPRNHFPDPRLSIFSAKRQNGSLHMDGSIKTLIIQISLDLVRTFIPKRSPPPSARSLDRATGRAGAVSVVVASDFDERDGLRKRESERASERAAPRSELRIAVRVAQRSLTQSHRDRGSATDGSNRKTLEEVDLLPACHLLDRFLRLKQQLLGLEGEVSLVQ